MHGELHVGGFGLARGYLNRPDLTAERFMPDPSGGKSGARLYKTGDRVRWLPDGQLEFLGRIDHQLKVRGFRVEPGEVEAVLCRHPDVRQAVVVAAGQQQLAAYVVPAEGQAPTPTELREFARQHLPEYMVPGLFMALEKLPLTPSGKAESPGSAGPRGGGNDSELRAAEGRPRNRSSRRCGPRCCGWSGSASHDNFFELGGHSLLAMQVLRDCDSAVGVDVPIPVFFNTPTVAGLAALDRGQPA